jgi:Na+-translocating ferredoxin:NAD+ oxidoreductase RnfG subunit
MRRRRSCRARVTVLTPIAVAVAVVVAFAPVPLAGQAAQLTQDEALSGAFPAAADVQRHTAYLDEADLDRARQLAGAGVEMQARVVTYYEALDAQGGSLGTAWFDAHRVRTLPEVLMVVVEPDGVIRDIDVLRFAEPPEYAPASGWLAQFRGRPLDDELSLKGGIVAITGATLTADAVTDAARRVLALRQVIGAAHRVGARR